MKNQNQKRDRIFNELVKLSVLLGTEETEQRLELTSAVLEKYELKEVIKAIHDSGLTCKFFPKPVELIEKINPPTEREDADFIAGEIIRSIRDFGGYQSREAREYIGEEAWQVVQMCGGWDLICGTPEGQLGTLRAQLRNVAYSVLKKDEIQHRKQLRVTQQEAKVQLFMRDKEAARVDEFEKMKHAQIIEFKKKFGKNKERE